MAEHTPGARATTWAVHEAALPLIAAAARREPSDPQANEPQAIEPTAGLRPTSTGGVALLPLRGLITARPSYFSLLFGGGSGLMSFRSALREAVASDDVAAIVLDVDSPGGSTDLLTETAAEIRAARQVKPVVAVANTWAASAAYWLAAQADELVVTPSGEVGSIGVLCMHQDITGLDAQLGVNVTILSAGKYKAELNPHTPLSDEARDALQTKIDEFYGLFVGDVARGRGVSVSAVRGGYGEGRMVTAKQSLEFKMADRVGTLEDTIARLVRNPTRARRRALAAEDPATTIDFAANPQPNAEQPPAEEAAARNRRRFLDLRFATRL